MDEVKKTPQEELWAGSFGDDYTGRNRVDWRARRPFWEKILAMTRPDNIMEVGCNAGWNMRAIHDLSPGTKVLGIDVNQGAVRQARQAGLDATITRALDCGDLMIDIDLVFTAGVLIHVAPDDLEPTMGALIERTHRYVLAVEYDSDQENEIEYRGGLDRLWKRPFGQMYEALGLNLVATGDAPGFDRCTYWLMEKP